MQPTADNTLCYLEEVENSLKQGVVHNLVHPAGLNEEGDRNSGSQLSQQHNAACHLQETGITPTLVLSPSPSPSHRGYMINHDRSLGMRLLGTS